MSSNEFDLAINAGATYTLVITVANTDLTSYSARMQIRRAANSDVEDFGYVTETDELSITNAAGGEITLTIPATDTDAMDGEYCYDMEIVDGNSPPGVTRILQGAVKVSPNVTR